MPFTPASIVYRDIAFSSGRFCIENYVNTSDQSSKTSVKFLGKNNGVAQTWLKQGGKWVFVDDLSISQSLGTLTSGKNYDAFAYLDGTTPTLEYVAWTNDTTRATAIANDSGAIIKSGDATRRLVGAFRTVSTTATTDARNKRFVVSLDNPENLELFQQDTTTTWNPTGTSWTTWNSSTTNRVEFLCLLDTTWVEVNLEAQVLFNSADNLFVGLDLDGVTSSDAQKSIGGGGNGIFLGPNCRYGARPGIGYHFLQMMHRRQTGAGTCTVRGQDHTGTIWADSAASGHIRS